MPDAFHYRENVLYCEDVELSRLAAHAGTPCYVYSAAALKANFLGYERALEGVPHRVCYAVKANGNLSVLRLLASLGAGFDIVSGGELFRVLKAGGDASSVVFAGVGKTREEIDYALESGIHSFNCESEAELALISSLASRLGRSRCV
jgi:diaminopimelate decarboxylase